MAHYFAYGSNLSPAQMLGRCASAVLLCRASLHGFELTFPRRSKRWGGGGVAGLIEAPAATVHGVVYEISRQDLEMLDSYEGADTGRYVRREVDVRSEAGTLLRAFTYFALPEDGWPFAPDPRYIATMLEGARRHGLPAPFIHDLETRLKPRSSPPVE